MKKINLPSELIAPCGMNCGICRAHLANFSKYSPEQRKKLQTGFCPGCRTRHKMCAFLKKHCPYLFKEKIKFCYQCPQFPCFYLERLDNNYRKNYQMSMIDNLKMIKRDGMKKFLAQEKRRWRCKKCGGVVCVHDKKCYDCGNKLKGSGHLTK